MMYHEIMDAKDFYDGLPKSIKANMKKRLLLRLGLPLRTSAADVIDSANMPALIAVIIDWWHDSPALEFFDGLSSYQKSNDNKSHFGALLRRSREQREAREMGLLRIRLASIALAKAGLGFTFYYAGRRGSIEEMSAKNDIEEFAMKNPFATPSIYRTFVDSIGSFEEWSVPMDRAISAAIVAPTMGVKESLVIITWPLGIYSRIAGASEAEAKRRMQVAVEAAARAVRELVPDPFRTTPQMMLKDMDGVVRSLEKELIDIYEKG